MQLLRVLCGLCRSLCHSFIHIVYTHACSKKGATKLMVVTSQILTDFQIFFHHWKKTEISNKIHILFPTAP